MQTQDFFFLVGGNRVHLNPVSTVRLVVPARDRHPIEVGARLSRSSRIALDKSVPKQFLVVRGDPSKLDEIVQYPDVAAVRNAFADPSGHELILTDQLLVHFRSGVPVSVREDICRRHGVSVTDDQTDLWTVHVTDPDGNAPLRISNALSEESDVEYAEPNALQAARHSSMPTDPLFINQWHLYNTGQNGGVPGADVKALEAWEISQGDQKVRIVIHDSGVDIDHPDLISNMDEGWDFDNGDANASNNHSAHGTACAGIAAARTNKVGVTGVAPFCRIVPLRAAGALLSSTWAKTFEWAAKQGNVISCSFSLGKSNTVSKAIHKVVKQAGGGNGVPIFCATGNDGKSAADFPANHPDTIGVGASNNLDERSSYSQIAPGLDFLAPSDGGTLGIETTDNVGKFGYNPQGDYCKAYGGSAFSGTSAATPLAAGVAALLLSVDPNLTTEDVRRIMRLSCDRIDWLNAKYDGDGFSRDYGYGRINAAAALSLAKFDVATQLLTPTVVFRDVPEKEETWRAIVWEFASLKSATFKVVNSPSDPFRMLLNENFVTVQKPAGHTRGTARLWVAYKGTKANDREYGEVQVGCEETGEEWTVRICANVVKRPAVAVALVLDKSRSMDFPVNGKAVRRVDLLRDASWNFVNYAPAGTGVGVVHFNHVDPAELALPLTTIGHSASEKARASIREKIEDVTPRGNTSIGNGVRRASLLLGQVADPTEFDSMAMIVVTDGQENRPDWIKDVVKEIPHRDKIFAIGLGEANVIDPEKLTLLTDITGTGTNKAYVSLTGKPTRDSSRILTKYYSQILTGLLNWQVVLDPEGHLTQDERIIDIPFDLTSLDLGVDVVLMASANRIHETVVFLDLISPEGTRISYKDLPKGVEYHRGTGSMVYYRFALPVTDASASPGSRITGSPGRWVAKVHARGDVPGPEGWRFTLSVHARSQIQMEADLTQASMDDAVRMRLKVKLTESGQPVRKRRANVKAIVDGPGGSREITLTEVVDDEVQFREDIYVKEIGLYRFRIKATGRNLRNEAFTREQIRTGAVYVADRPPRDEEEMSR